MTAVERAADLLARMHSSGPADYLDRSDAQALADAGLLRPEWATDEAKAVLDAAVDHVLHGTASTWMNLDSVTRDYLDPRQVTT